MDSSDKRGLILRTVLITLLLLTISGCSYMKNFWGSSKQDATEMAVVEKDSYTIPITSVPSGKVYFRNISAKFDGADLVVRGRVRNRYPISIFGGHVVATLYDPDDNQIAKANTYQTPRTIRKLGRNRGEESRFKVKFAKEPPEGSRVVVWFKRKKISRGVPVPHS